METKKRTILLFAGLAGLVTVIWYYATIVRGEVTYDLRPEVRPHIRLPEYRSDAARAIDAYERLMNRYMSLTERNLQQVNTTLLGVDKKLDSINFKLAALSGRISRIEKALGIKPPEESLLRGPGVQEPQLYPDPRQENGQQTPCRPADEVPADRR